MSAVDDLPPDRRAVLQLLLHQGKSYEDLAALLRIGQETVRSRAADALAALAQAAGVTDRLTPDEATVVGDYLLGQQSASARQATRELLETSQPARTWAWAVAGELRDGGLPEGALPEIPADAAEVDEAFDALDARREAHERTHRRSRLGAVLIGLAALIVAALVVVLITTTGGDSDDAGPSTTAATATATTPAVLAQAKLSSAGGAAGATVQIVRQGRTLAMVFRGTGIPRHGDRSVYAMWLTGAANGSVAPRRLGFIKNQAKADGTLDFVGALPEPLALASYARLLMTREVTERPTTPGEVVLAGTLVTP